jgi:hypothetical protein
MADDADGAPLVRTGDIENAEFRVNRVTVEGDKVVEEEVGVELDEETIEKLQEDIDTDYQKARDAMEEGVAETVEEAVDTAFESNRGLAAGADEETEPAGPAPPAEQESDTDGDSDEETAESDEADAPGDDGGDEHTLSSAIAQGRVVVNEEGVTTTDFFTYQSAMRDRGFDSDLISESWDVLRDDDAIPKGGSGSDASNGDESGAGSVDVDAEVAGDEPAEEIELPAGVEMDEGDTILVAHGEEEASQVAITVLDEAIENEEVRVVLTNDDMFEEMLELVLKPLDAPVEVPAAVEWTGETFAETSLQSVFAQYGDA